MSIYDKPTWQLMKDMAKEKMSSPGSIVTKDEVRDWFTQHYPKIKRATVDLHMERMSTNAPTRVHLHGKPGNDDLFVKLDRHRYRLYDPDNDAAPIYRDDTAAKSDDEGSDETIETGGSETEFAFESDLRDYLAKNLNQLEPGLVLYDDGEGIKGIEFPVGGRYIDILAIDQSNNLVVIELKVSRGYDRVVGQLLRYQNWIKKNLANEDQSVRGIIVANEISEDLKLACEGLPGVSLFEYELSMTLKEAK